jgi:ABC-type iron transport system FetAB ATPase subunit
MIDVKDLNFNLNEKNEIIYSGSVVPGQPIKMEVVEGDSVSLKKGEINIEVENIVKLDESTYKGLVKYVEPYRALVDDNVDDGIEITFSYGHIFVCSAR